MRKNKGFTLLELMIAIVILAVGFSVVFELLSKARLDYTQAQTLQEDLLELNKALVEGKTEGLLVEKRTLEDYPEVEEVSYRLGSAEIFVYELKR
ncbi:MAG: type II secretion system protein [Desulfurococcaceae archaeon]